MASVVLFDAARMQAIEDGTVVSGLVDIYGHLILTTHDGTDIDAGVVKADNFVPADHTTAGVVELATSAEVATGTDDVRAVTPKGLFDSFPGYFNTDMLAGLSDPDYWGTTSQKGLVELATSAEAIAATDNTRALTPADLTAVLGAGNFDSRYYTSTEIDSMLALEKIYSASFSAVNHVDLFGFFSSVADRFRVVCRWQRSAGATSTIQLVSGTTLINGANYRQQYTSATSTTVSAAAQTSATFWSLNGNPGGAAKEWFSFEIDSIATTDVTVGDILMGMHYDASGAMWVNTQSALHSLSVAYDGLQLAVNAGTVTGHVEVFRYRK